MANKKTATFDFPMVTVFYVVISFRVWRCGKLNPNSNLSFPCKIKVSQNSSLITRDYYFLIFRAFFMITIFSRYIKEGSAGHIFTLQIYKVLKREQHRYDSYCV